MMFNDSISPEITAYSAILLIFAAFVKHSITVLDHDELIEKFYKFSKDENCKCLFEDICFRNHFDYVSSEDIEDALATLMTFGGISIISPAYEKIVIHFYVEEAGGIMKDYEDSEFAKAAEYIAENYENLEETK